MKIAVIGSYAKALVMTTDRIPLAGETLVGREYRGTYGGKGSDMAVQAARLSCDVGYLGVVGNDDFGNEFLSLLHANGVATDGVRQDETLPTGVGFIIKDTAARNVIVVDPGANDMFSPADIDAHLEQFVDASVALAQLEIPLTTALYGLAKAKAAGLTTVLNPAPAIDLRDVDLSGIDVVTPNESEARLCVGLAPDDPTPNSVIAQQLIARGAGAVVMTLGDDGAEVITTDGSEKIAPFRIDVVDSNGAGDSFNASLCVALAEGKSLTDAARFASAVAALCCTKWETVPSYHNRDEVEAFLAGAVA